MSADPPVVVEGDDEEPDQNALGVWTKFHQGPLPSPDTLAEYDALVPGAAADIIRQAKGQSAHRQKIELAVVNNGIRQSYLGQILAFAIAMAVILGAIYLILQGKSVEGLTSLILALGSLLGAFYMGKKGQGTELREKRDSLKASEPPTGAQDSAQ